MGGRHRRSRLADEAGFALIEALVGAVVLIVVAVATLGAIDRAQKTSAFAKNKSVAAALAEQDQARLRGLPADSLSTYATNHTTNRTVAVNGLNYTVASTVDWIRDDTGSTLSCTSSGQADYLKLTSTVSANAIQPVTITSLASPPLSYSSSRGTLVVQVNDGATTAAGVSGVNVAIDGPVDMSGTTNALGCAVFSFVPAGSYDIGIFKNGYVDYGGTTNPHQTKTVAGASLTTGTFIYDAAGSIKVNFETDISQTATPSLSRSRGYNASAFNTLVPAPQFRTASDPGAPVPAVTLSTLFPFRTAYNTYAGTCAAANPKTAIPNVNWFNSGNIGFDDNAIVPPGDNTGVTVTVRQPALEVRVKDSAGAYINGANVTITQSGTGCAPASFTGWKTVTHPQANTDGWITKPPYDFGAGTVNYDPGVPFGTYTVCADAVTGTGTNQRRRKAYSLPITVNSAGGTAGADIVISTTGIVTQSCP